MHRMLIVDDEPYITDSLIELMESTDLELELYKAYNGGQALDIIKYQKMDIVLTDIEMPDINGLELQKKVIQLWPDTQVLFLTGYNYFEYAHSALRNGSSDYLLKTESETTIIQAVVKAMERINQHKAMESTLSKAEQQINAVTPMLQKEYIVQLLSNKKSTAKARSKHFSDLSISLDPNQSLIMMVGRVDDWKEEYSLSDRSLFLFSIQNIAQEYLSKVGCVQTTVYDHSRFVWLLQTDKRDSNEVELNRIQDLLDSIQSTCKRLLYLSLSLVATEKNVEWNHIAEYFSELCFTLNRGIGMGQEMILTYTERTNSEQWDHAKTRVKMNIIDLLEDSLEKGKVDTFFRLFQEVGDIYIQGPDAFSYEIYCRLVSMFYSYMNRWGVSRHQGVSGNFRELMDIQMKSKEESWSLLLDQFEWLFRTREDDHAEQSHEIVARLHAHINGNLAGDLTLQALSEIVHLNPYYLSRLYKQLTGALLKETIMEKRLERALELLKATEMQAQEIAAKIGFESNAYFTRFFKKKINMTPIEYRESSRNKGKKKS